MRRSLSLWVLGVGALVLAATAWANGLSVAPPKCSPTNSLKGVTLRSGRGAHDAPLYLRSCGGAQAVVQVRGTRHVIRGGYCRRLHTLPTDPRARYSVAIGLVTNEPAAPGRGIGFWWAQPAKRAGRFKIAESGIQVAGKRLGGDGFVTVSRGLNSGTFSFFDPRAATRITGTYRC